MDCYNYRSKLKNKQNYKVETINYNNLTKPIDIDEYDMKTTIKNINGSEMLSTNV